LRTDRFDLTADTTLRTAGRKNSKPLDLEAGNRTETKVRVFVDVGCKVSKGPSMFFSHCYGVILHAFGVLQQERFQIAEIHIQAIKKLRHRPTGHNGEVAAK